MVGFGFAPLDAFMLHEGEIGFLKPIIQRPKLDPIYAQEIATPGCNLHDQAKQLANLGHGEPVAPGMTLPTALLRPNNRVLQLGHLSPPDAGHTDQVTPETMTLHPDKRLEIDNAAVDLDTLSFDPHTVNLG